MKKSWLRRWRTVAFILLALAIAFSFYLENSSINNINRERTERGQDVASSNLYLCGEIEKVKKQLRDSIIESLKLDQTNSKAFKLSNAELKIIKKISAKDLKRFKKFDCNKLPSSKLKKGGNINARTNR